MLYRRTVIPSRYGFGMCDDDLGGQGGGHGGGVAGRGQLLMLHRLDPELVLVDVDDVLVGGVGLGEGVQLVHLPDVGPQVNQASGDLKLAEECS